MGLYEEPYEPWIESLLNWASKSSSHVTFMDHQRRRYENEANFSWLNMSSYLRSQVVEPSQQFDIIVNYQIGERLGLGRYGEQLSVDADLDAVEVAECMLKPGGLLVLGVTLAREPDDLASHGYIVYNVGRVYGEARLQKMINGWVVRSERVFKFGTIKVYVLQKI